MIDVTNLTFEAEIVEASMHTPVLIDFWAPWCEPCKVLGPILEKLETDYAGRFILAKIDSDTEQEIAGAFGIRSIPTCVLMVGGKPVDGFQGALPEGQLKAFLDKNLPPATESEAPAEPEATEFIESTPEMQLETLVAKLKDDASNEDLRFDLVKLLLQLGRDDDAKVAFAPVIAKTSVVRKFDSLKRWMDAIDSIAIQAINTPASTKNEAKNGINPDFDAKIAANKRDFEARFGKAQALMAQQRWTDAMDELLEILMRDKTWNEDLARKTYIAILDIIEPAPVKVADGHIPPVDPTVATYRRRLSSVVLS
ncbi:MAG: tetratricopeptide repeat protein [Burkholderiaceae bacterium]|nr:tetratricopeptide repeat protein [Burkholderiaceae bacterium]